MHIAGRLLQFYWPRALLIPLNQIQAQQEKQTMYKLYLLKDEKENRHIPLLEELLDLSWKTFATAQYVSDLYSLFIIFLTLQAGHEVSRTAANVPLCQFQFYLLWKVRLCLTYCLTILLSWQPSINHHITWWCHPLSLLGLNMKFSGVDHYCYNYE